MISLAKMWSLVLLLPLIPVVFLYLLFEKQNYFELQDTARGIVAVGPIAAYIVLVLIALKVYQKISPSFLALNPDLDKLRGEWTFESTSKENNVRVGDCFIHNEKGQLVINGTFKDGNETVGNWESELAGFKENNLLMVYMLRDNETGENLYGLAQITISNPEAASMSGVWSVVGRDGLRGKITYTRKPKSN